MYRSSEEELNPFARNNTGSLHSFHENDWQSPSSQTWDELHSLLMLDHSFSNPFYSETENNSLLQYQLASIPSLAHDTNSMQNPSNFPHPDFVQPFLPMNYYYPLVPCTQEVPHQQDIPRRCQARKLSPRSSEFFPKKNKEREDNRIDIEKVKRGEDKRTTLMVRNIPNGYLLLASCDLVLPGRYLSVSSTRSARTDMTSSICQWIRRLIATWDMDTSTWSILNLLFCSMRTLGLIERVTNSLMTTNGHIRGVKRFVAFAMVVCKVIL